MKRVLCAALLGAAALATPASAGPGIRVEPTVTNRPDRVGVFVSYDFGHGEEPLGGAWVNPQTGQVCVGFSFQIPQCVGGEPIE